MILTEEEVNNRLSSPDNLLNRLRNVGKKEESMEIFIPQAPSVSDLVENVEDKIKLNLAASGAVRALEASVSELERRIPEVEKAKDLSKIARDMSAIVGTIDEMKNGGRGGRGTHITIWQPILMQENNYETVIARE